MTQRFSLGRILATPGVLEAIPQREIITALTRHTQGDWGTLDPEDWQANNQAVSHGGRVLSAYSSTEGRKFWIITEWDRSATTILLPEEY